MSRIFIIVLTLSLCACASYPMGLRHNVLVDGQSISFVQNTDHAPTVVFEAGLGNDLKVWADVYDEVSTFAGTFAYSRPGYSGGFMRLAIGDRRTADDSARLLHEVLRASGATPPYILVGHSVGGLYVLEFARDYPDLVAGLVLVDARLPGFTEQCMAADVGPCLPPASAIAVSPPHIAAEIRGILPSEVAAPMPGDLGSIPVTLLAATKPPPGASVLTQPVWLSTQREFAAALSNGQLLVAEGSGHFIQRDAPQLVVDAIRNMVTGGHGPRLLLNER